MGNSRPTLSLALLLPLLLGVASARPARAQDGASFSLKLHWTSDSVASPAKEECVTSGTVGGYVNVRIAFVPPPGAIGATVREIRIEETAGHYPALIASNTAFNGVAHPACGDTGEGVFYADSGWFTTAHHNGAHSVTAVVDYTAVVDGQYVTRSLTKTLQVTLGNLLVTGTSPANPTPIYWDGETPVPLTVSFSCAYRAAAEAKLEIFTTEQVLVRTLTQAITTLDSSAPFVWDGLPESAQSPDDALESNPYLFRFTLATNPPGGLSDRDSDKSAFLTIGASPEPCELISSSAESAVYKVHYELASDRAASEGRVNVFHRFGEMGQTGLPATSLTPGAQSAAVTVVGDAADYLIFLVSARDDHSTLDRGHRKSWALQHNQQQNSYSVALFGDASPRRLRDAWELAKRGWLHNGKVTTQALLPSVLYSLAKPPGDINRHLTVVRQPAPQDGAATAYYTLHTSRWMRATHIWSYFGHGEGPPFHGRALAFHDGAHISDSIIVPGSRASHQIAAMPAGSLSRVLLAVLAACESGSRANPHPNSTSLEGILRQKGVAHTLSFARTINTTIAGLWFENFWKLWTEGASGRHGDEIAVAARDAQAIAIAGYDQISGGVMSGSETGPFVLHNGKDVGG